MNTLLFSGVAAPEIPNWLMEHATHVSKTEPSVTVRRGDSALYTQRTLITANGPVQNAFNNGWLLDDSCLDWVRQNISNQAVDIRYNITGEGQNSGPHCDRSRNYTMIYLLEPGGPDHETVFYRENGCDFIRELGYHVDDYKQLKRISSTKLLTNKWTLLNSRILHSVENIPNGRISFQINFNEIPNNLHLLNPVYL